MSEVIYEQEPNNFRDEAQPLEFNKTYKGKLNLGLSPDGDCYVAFLRPGTINVSFIIPENTNYRIRIYKEGELNNPIAEQCSPECYTDRFFEFTVPVGENANYYFSITPYLWDMGICAVDPDEYYELEITYKSITLPVNINQHYSGFLNSLSNQCAAVCVLDVDIYYNDNYCYEGYNANSIKTEAENLYNYAIGPSGVIWGAFDCCSVSDYKTASTKKALYDALISEIKSGRPVLVNYCNSLYTHWVVVTSIEDDFDSMLAYDPSVSVNLNCFNDEQNTEDLFISPWSMRKSICWNLRYQSPTEYRYKTTSKKQENA